MATAKRKSTVPVIDDISEAYDILEPGKKKVKEVDIYKQKDPTGGKKNTNYAKLKQKERVTKKMKRQLAAVQQRKQNKTTQEELFASLAEYQLDPKTVRQLSSTTFMQDKNRLDREVAPEFSAKLKAYSSKAKLAETLHAKDRVQENYFPTDDEASTDEAEDDEEEKEENEDSKQDDSECEESETILETRHKQAGTSSALTSEEIRQASKTIEASIETVSKEIENKVRNRQPKEKITVGKKVDEDEEDAELAKDNLSPENKIFQRTRVVVERSPEINESRQQLPIYGEEVPIVEAINDNIVTVVCGETGSGKTTQIPQFLYEAGYASDGQIIGITEPRRVAAISMAQRVGIELGQPNLVSYQIRYEGNRNDETKILYMTDGVLMKEMEKDVMLNKYSAILIDEAHERSMYSDVLIGMLSRIAPLRAKTNSPLRLVIMSATLRLQDFLQKRLFPTVQPKVIKVDSRQFPVTVHFEKKTPEDYIYASFRKACKIHESLPDGGILIFVSGQKEVKHLINKFIARYPISLEEKDGELLVKGSRAWKSKKKDEVKALKLEDFEETKEKVSENLDGEDLQENDVGGDAWDDYDEEFVDETPLNDSMGPPPSNARPLFCLPLYSLLSSEKQQRVFQSPPDGTRLCVITTNVAETSLTIPGIKYVVDAGFEKQRLYDPITGVSRFVVARISQASADQRAGRAGRICAGHAYRLFSSAVFQDFPKFAKPDILLKPAEQLVLHLKSMNIVKVINFPFPSPPDREVLDAAEKRLIKLDALSTTTKNGKTEARITSLGRILSMFPLSPSYAKVIAMANQHGLMPYAICLIAALSVREPLVPVYSLRGDTEEETKTLMTEVLKMRRGWCGQGPSRRLGDLLVLLRSVFCSEDVEMDTQACHKVGLRPKAMIEIRQLRTQLTNIVNTSFKDTENVVMELKLQPPSPIQAQMLRQMMVAGLAENIARRVDRSVTDEEIPRGAYQTTKLQEYVFIDPCSVLYTEDPDYVLYQDIVQLGEKKCMQGLMTVDYEWLPTLAESHCSFGAADKEVEPKYCAKKDLIVNSVGVKFGPLEWSIGNFDREINRDIMYYRYFCQFLLKGEVVPMLAEYAGKLIAPPTTMVKSWAKLQQRTENLLNALIEKDICSRVALVEEFEKDENFLLQEYLEWVPESLHGNVSIMWPPIEKTERMGRNKKHI
ncbi:unnamed protein product [Auanema sp. JU1783]|nr:unnamed protein product [Auanema sp. JU1783]